MPTFYWHDYETWGRNPALDRPSQFAGLRTDAELNEIGEPLSLFCQPDNDMLPEPEACLITGITPQRAQAEGVPEHEFIRRIHAELAAPGTCGVGYNSLRFDDEFTRHTLYRNFYDPYAREWQNGNSRWDLIDTVRLAAALRPEGMQWPTKDDGAFSFRLEDLTAANGIQHAGAHDALVDVRATVALARKLRQAQPKLWQWVQDNRGKAQASAMLDPAQQRPVLHVSSRFGGDRCCMAMVLPLTWHATNKNSIIVYDLSVDPQPLIDLGVEAIAQRVFTRHDAMPAGMERIPLKQVHINKSPILAPITLLDKAASRRTRIDMNTCTAHLQKLLKARGLGAKVKSVFANQAFTRPDDVDAQLYSGFFADADRRVMQAIREQAPAALAGQTFAFNDARLEALLFRYRARHAPETLSAEEQTDWQQQRLRRLTEAGAGARTLAEVRQRIAALRTPELATDKQAVLDSLETWLQQQVPAAVWQQAGQSSGQEAGA